MAQIDHPQDADQPAITWRGPVPVAKVFDDLYYSLEDGFAEARYVFLAGNDLPTRFVDGFHIAELGFGTGLNLFAAALAWRKAGCAGRLYFTTFEQFPLDLETAQMAWDAFPETAPLHADLKPLWQGETALELPWLRVEVIAGDARATLPLWQGAADAWFLDGFSPARNPELWSADLMAEVGAHTRPGGTFATYTAAGDVRRALDAAGFEVSRAQGYGRKRHMSKGRLR
ncbi:MAG: tRNA (5-methylaminomethyl-2-thiouridine)(34)-methyltransferase MnmD [Pseudomonadota bacterium]